MPRKGDQGRVVIIAGSKEYFGALYFACQAALYSGVDSVRVITVPSCGEYLKPKLPETVVHILANWECWTAKLADLCTNADAVVLGCGLGREFPKEILASLLTMKIKLVVDGDGIWHLIKFWTPQTSDSIATVIVTPNHREMNNWLINFCPLGQVDIQKSIALVLNGTSLILEKDLHDTIWTETAKFVDLQQESGFRRYSGQGDILAGLLGGLIAQPDSKIVDCAKIASKWTKQAGKQACEKFGYATTATDHLDELKSLIATSKR